MSVNFSSYKEIIKSPIIYRGDHSGVRAKDHNGMKVINEKFIRLAHPKVWYLGNHELYSVVKLHDKQQNLPLCKIILPSVGATSQSDQKLVE